MDIYTAVCSYNWLLLCWAAVSTSQLLVMLKCQWHWKC